MMAERELVAWRLALVACSERMVRDMAVDTMWSGFPLVSMMGQIWQDGAHGKPDRHGLKHLVFGAQNHNPFNQQQWNGQNICQNEDCD